VPSQPISASASGDNSVIAGQPGYAIRVIAYVLTFSGAVNAKWMSDIGGSAVALSGLLYGPLASGAPTSIVAPAADFGARGWFQTAVGKALNLNLSAAVPVGRHILYEVVGQT
jgi:hypothetical protein